MSCRVTSPISLVHIRRRCRSSNVASVKKNKQKTKHTQTCFKNTETTDVNVTFHLLEINCIIGIYIKNNAKTNIDFYRLFLSREMERGGELSHKSNSSHISRVRGGPDLEKDPLYEIVRHTQNYGTLATDAGE